MYVARSGPCDFSTILYVPDYFFAITCGQMPPTFKVGLILDLNECNWQVSLNPYFVMSVPFFELHYLNLDASLIIDRVEKWLLVLVYCGHTLVTIVNWSLVRVIQLAFVNWLFLIGDFLLVRPNPKWDLVWHDYWVFSNHQQFSNCKWAYSNILKRDDGKSKSHLSFSIVLIRISTLMLNMPFI